MKQVHTSFHPNNSRITPLYYLLQFQKTRFEKKCVQLSFYTDSDNLQNCNPLA